MSTYLKTISMYEKVGIDVVERNQNIQQTDFKKRLKWGIIYVIARIPCGNYGGHCHVPIISLN